jgi:RNA-directed DNA polymerase
MARDAGAGMARVYYSLYAGIVSSERLRKGFLKVKSANGAAGVDGQSIEDFAKDLEYNLAVLVRELKEKSYKPMPVKRVEIPKPGGGIRKLGIPSVRDRVVQQALLNIMQPIFEPEFHPSSYGYRPGRSSHQAIAKAALFIRKYAMGWVVDMDVSQCFDTLDHEIIMAAMRKRISDGSILNLVLMFLQSGVMSGDGWQESRIGSPQGGVISPLIANVYLDAFDQFMRSRNHRIVRYADDILIFTHSRSAAENARQQATSFLEKGLNLTVNRQKSQVVHSDEGVKFLGVVIHTTYTRIREDKLRQFKEKVKGITRRNSPVNLERVILDLNPVCRGFANYFRIANCQRVFNELAKWIRRRLRAKQLKLWKKPKRLHRRLRQLGYTGAFTLIKMSAWRNAVSPQTCMALSNKYLGELGLFDLASVQTGIPVSVS